MKKKKGSRTAPVMREGKDRVIRSVPVKQLMPSKKTPVPVEKNPIPEVEAQPAMPDVQSAPAQTSEPEATVVLPPLPSSPAQLVHVPTPLPPSRSIFSLSATAIAACLLLSLGANVLLWKQYKGIASSMNALAAQYNAQLPVELSANALAGDLQAYNGKRVRINALTLIANHPKTYTMAAGQPNSKGSIDVFYENARNTPAIKTLTPAPTRTVSVTGTFNRYENDNTWYIEAETIQ